MKVHRFLYPTLPVGSKLTISDKTLAHQIARVLKLQVGEYIVLTDGHGTDITVQLTNIANTIDGTITDRHFFALQKNNVTLYVSLLKKENFELVIQKAVEIGVQKIVPIICERTVKLGFKRDRLETILKEAMEQSGQSYLPTMSDPETLRTVLQEENTGRRLFLDQSGQSIVSSKEKNLSLFVGPEGGWSEAELVLAKEQGCEVVQLGGTTLRAETAAIIGSFVCANL